MVLAQMQSRRGTAADWSTANPVLAAGEIGLETDTGKTKMGNGGTTWNLLPYWPSATGDLTLNNLTAGDINAEDITANTLTVDTITLDGVVLGVYQTYVPTVAGVDATVNFAKWARIGPQHAVGTVIITLDDAPGGEVTITLPDAPQIALTKPVIVGNAAILDVSTSLSYIFTALVFDGFGDDIVYFNNSDPSTSAYLGSGQGWDAGDVITAQFSFPIAP